MQIRHDENRYIFDNHLAMHKRGSWNYFVTSRMYLNRMYVSYFVRNGILEELSLESSHHVSMHDFSSEKV